MKCEGFVLGNDQDSVLGEYEQFQQFIGSVSDLRIYDKGFSQEEVKLQYKYDTSNKYIKIEIWYFYCKKNNMRILIIENEFYGNNLKIKISKLIFKYLNLFHIVFIDFKYYY